MKKTRIGLLLGLGLVACSGEDDGRATASGTGITGSGTATATASGTATDSTSDTASGSASGGSDTNGTSGGTDSTSDSDSGNPKFDVGGGDDLGGNVTDGNNDGCAKVDLLFIVDNSGSMAEEEAKLIANFPTFSNQIQTQLADVDSYHLMVTSTDSYDTASSDTTINDDNPACQVMGASITKSDVGLCTPYAEGNRYMTDMDDLGARFQCAANLGTAGSGEEKVGDAIVGAVSAAQNGAGGCQEGFLRDDALLVIVVLTDEDDAEHSQGGPQQWYDAVVAAKVGLPDNVVVLSLVWDDSNGNPYNCTSNGLPPLIPGDQEYGATIVQFTQMFTNGSVGNICATDYGPFFMDAISVIESACNDFKPPG